MPPTGARQESLRDRGRCVVSLWVPNPCEIARESGQTGHRNYPPRREGATRGWIPDQPSARDGQRADLSWETPIDPEKHAKDVALRFRAHLVPPPPPPTPTDTAVPAPGAPGAPIAPPRQGVIRAGSGSVTSGEPGG